MENQIKSKKYFEWLTVIGLLIVFLAPRLIGLAKFATLDEPYWLVSGSNFYYALGQRDFASTVWDYHPAVTTMWLITLVLMFYFPAYRGQGQGYFYVYKEWKWEAFLKEFGKQAIDVLFYSRLLQALLLAALFILLYWLMQKVAGKRITIAALLFLSFDPMFLGHSRLLTHEAMLVTFLLVSFTSMAVYLFAEKKFGFVLLSAVMGALAQLTKSSGIVLFPLILLLIAIKIWDERKSVPILKNILERLKMIAVWAAALALVYVAVWPGMWVRPVSILHEVYGNALSYAFKGARLYTTQNLDNINFNVNPGRINFYAETMLWRTTPLMWLGLLAAITAFFKRNFLSKNGKYYLGLTAIFGLGMFMMFALLKGRDSAHYIMLTYAAFDICAGIGLLAAFDWLARNKIKPGNLFFGIALAIQAAFVIPFYPYYYTYYSPIMEAVQPGVQNGNFGYGEGLDLAAKYLNQKNDARSLTVLAYWGNGPFSYFFDGRTIMLVNNYYKPELKNDLLADLRRSDYLVIYYQFQKSMARVMNVVDALEPYPPEHVIWMNGIESIRIYNIHELPKEFFDFIANQ
jgi:4-amino-4-deoxy-L-arabinose transferase-like glycosyltransferase